MTQSTLSEQKGYGEQFDVEGLNFFRRLLAAIQNEEFVVYFQPKVSIADMKIAGAEALVRWNCDGQIIPPVKFIPFCERTGLVIDIDFYVLEQTCKKMREWMDAGIELVRVSVNFSKYHFNERGVAERIYEVIQKYGISTKYIEVEFTETAYLDKEELLEYTVDKLKSYGIKSSIDDFGSGYSSLNLLQNMDFEVVKLDKSLLGKGVENVKAKKVISSIIHMAKELEMEVLAEGVETREELKLLKELKCDIVQGFLFDKPLPQDEFERRLRAKFYTKNCEVKEEREPMKLQDFDMEDIKVSRKTEKPSEPAVNKQESVRYMQIDPEYKKSKSYKGVFVAGVILMLLSIGVLVGSMLLAGNQLGKKDTVEEPEVITYTQEEVDTLLSLTVMQTEENVREEMETRLKSNLHDAAEVNGGMANYLRSVFTDEMVYIDGNKFKLIPIDRSLKLSSVEAARFVKDEETGFLFYTDESGNHTSYMGIDVSSFQKDIDWSKVAESGIEFAIIRCGFRGYGSEGKLVEDTYFKKNIEGALKAGLNVGIYFYTQAVSVEEAKEEAEFAMGLLKGYSINGPVVLDVESANPSEERIKDLDATLRTDIIISFCDTVSAAGYKPMIYADEKFFSMKMEMNRLEAYEKWFANYNSLEMRETDTVWSYNNPLRFPYEYSIWQYSSAGNIEGVKGDVDFDVLFEKWW